MQPAAQLSSVAASAPTDEVHSRRTACWAAIDFPLLALAVHSIKPVDRAVVTEPTRRGNVVYQASDSARAMGITPGLNINAAQTLCTGLDIYPRDVQAEQQHLQICTRWARRFTPMVCREYPTTVLLDIGASLRLFGGLDALCEQLRHGLSRCGHCYYLAVTPTPAASLIMARFGREVTITDKAHLRTALGELPVTSLGLRADTLHEIEAIGVDSLYELWRLPRRDVARRFGVGVIRKTDRLLGICPDPRQPDSLPLDFAHQHELPEETADIASVLLVTRFLLARLMKFLRRADATAAEIQLVLHHSQASVTRIKAVTRLPTRSFEPWAKLLSEHLQGHRLQAPVVRIGLLSERLLPSDAATSDLFHRGDPARDWARSLDELEARLGKNRVWIPRLVADHRPEYAWHRSHHDGVVDTSSGAQRPLWLLREPQRLRYRTGRVWRSGPLHLVEGPERIESGWWDNREYCRNYYTATSPQDGRLWIFQDLKQKNGWYLHGLFG